MNKVCVYIFSFLLGCVEEVEKHESAFNSQFIVVEGMCCEIYNQQMITLQA